MYFKWRNFLAVALRYSLGPKMVDSTNNDDVFEGSYMFHSKEFKIFLVLSGVVFFQLDVIPVKAHFGRAYVSSKSLSPPESWSYSKCVSCLYVII